MSSAAASLQPLYLSRLVLDPRARFLRDHFQNARALYGRLLGAFPESKLPHHTGGGPAENGRRTGGLLYRIEPEPDRETRGIVVLAQSSEAPDWDLLGTGLFAVHPPQPKLFTIDVAPGTRLRFRLRACPIKNSPPGSEIAPGKRQRGERKPVFADVIAKYPAAEERAKDSDLVRQMNIRIEQACADWLAEFLARSGAAELIRATETRWDAFAFDDEPRPLFDVRVTREAAVRFSEQQSWARGRGDISPVLFEGAFVVRDSAKLAMLVRDGIGPAKAFGCGLLSLARA